MTLELTGRVVLLTRRSEQGGSLRRALESRGATVLELPALEISPPADPGPIDAALRRLESFDWVAFASANAVQGVAARLQVLGLPAQLSARGAKIAVVGPGTAGAVIQAFPREEPVLSPVTGSGGKALAAAFAARGCKGEKVLLPVSSRGRDELRKGLLASGAAVERVVAYESRAPEGLSSALAGAVRQGAEVIVLASPSAVAALAGMPARGMKAVVIGSTTEQAARGAGFEVAAVADEPSDAGLLAAIARALEPSLLT